MQEFIAEHIYVLKGVGIFIIGLIIIAAIIIIDIRRDRIKTFFKTDNNEKERKLRLEFESIYDKIIKGNNRKNKYEINKNVIFLVIILGIILLWIFYLIISELTYLLFIFIPFIIILAITLIEESKGYTFKKINFIPEFVNEINKNLHYKKDGENTLNTYIRATMPATNKYLCYVDDMIYGKINENTDIKIYDCKILEMINTSGGVLEQLVFSGVLAIVNIDKSDIDIKITTKYINNKRAKLDNEEFNKHFYIDSKNEIDTFRILTTDIIEEMLKWKKQYKTDFEISIKKGNIHFKFYTRPLFQIKALKISIKNSRQRLEKENLFVDFKMIKYILDMTEKISNNIKYNY